MSKAIDSPLKFISDSFTGRDKLLKLAEGNSGKSKKKGSKLSLISSRSATDKDIMNDLSFTSNIEHLANKDFSQRSSTPIELNGEQDELNTSFKHDAKSNLHCDSTRACLAHTTSLNLETNSQLDLKFSDMRIGETSSFRSSSDFKTRIPQSVDRKKLKESNRMFSLNRWPDTEDLSKQNSSHSSPSQYGSPIGDAQNQLQTKESHSPLSNAPYQLTTLNHFPSQIPIYNHRSLQSQPMPFLTNINNTHFPPNVLPNSSTEKRFLRTNSFVSYLSDNNSKCTHLGNHSLKFHSRRTLNWPETQTNCRLPQSLTSQAISSHVSNDLPIEKEEESSSKLNEKMAKSSTHSALQGNISKQGFFAFSQRAHCQLPFSSDSDCAATSERITPQTNNTQNEEPQSGLAKNTINRLDSFFVMDEESFATNSPKKISNPPIPPKSSMLISTPDQQHYEKYFLRESQKTALTTINSTAANVVQSEQADKLGKSSSADSLNYFRYQALMKPKSETDLSETKNALTGIMHLEEDAMEEASMLNRFRKSFSLRFSKPWSSGGGGNKGQKPYSVAMDNSPAGEFSDSHLIISEEDRESLLSQCTSDINQNRIYRLNKHTESEMPISKMSTIERRKSRADIFNRKSFRRSSRKSLRLKRSHSQPNEKSGDQLSPQTDRSIDSDFDGNKSPLSDTKSSSELNESQEHDDILFAQAIWDYKSTDNEELSFNVGDLIDVTDTSHKEWWWGAIKNDTGARYGWFPASYVRLKVSQEETLEEALENTNEDLELTPKKRMSMSKMSSDQVRANIVLEIINTERVFVKNLQDVIDGFLKHCRNRVDMFDETRISTIFGNIEELYSFQAAFCRELEQAVDWTHLSFSQIGKCFLNNEKGFRVYSEFCTNHPLAISELQDLASDHRYIVFFEGCRLLQQMIDMPLDAFLLTPIQKICKYPLQLGELLKYTRTEHSDYEPVSSAFHCMTRVAQMVNERKRRVESLEQLITLQESFENWEGPDLLDSCSMMLHSGEVTRITSSSWSKDITLLLFDRLLVLCKKDNGILKKGTFIFKSRIEMDDVESLVSLEDNLKDAHFNVITKNAFKFFYKRKQKWYFFQAKSANERQRILDAFADERQRILDDELQGFKVTEKDKRSALIHHQNQLKPKKPRARRPHSKAKKPDTVIAEIPLGPLNGFDIDRNRAGSLPSYIHAERSVINSIKHRQSTMHKKSRSNWFQLGSNKKKNRLKRNLK